MLLRSTEDPDEGVSVSVWDSEEALLRYERSELRRNMAQEVENLYRGEFWVKHFEVTDTTSNPARRVIWPPTKRGREKSCPLSVLSQETQPPGVVFRPLCAAKNVGQSSARKRVASPVERYDHFLLSGCLYILWELRVLRYKRNPSRSSARINSPTVTFLRR